MPAWHRPEPGRIGRPILVSRSRANAPTLDMQIEGDSGDRSRDERRNASDASGWKGWPLAPGVRRDWGTSCHLMPYMAAIYSSMGRVKTTIYLDDAEYRRLKRLAEQERTSAAELIRAAVSSFLLRTADEDRPRSIGLGRSGEGDLSERVEEFLGEFGES